MHNLEEILDGVTTMAITGHRRPDGDAVGSAMGLYLYVLKHHPEITTDIYLEEPKPVFGHIDHIQDLRQRERESTYVYDLFVTCDVSSYDMMSVGRTHFDHARKRVCIDHHKSNTGFADINHICGSIGSCAEVLYELMDPEKVDLSVATAIYTGIAHDTGVFQFAATTPRTLRIAADLIEKGVDFSRIIEESFHQKTYVQNQVLGKILTESTLVMDRKMIIGTMIREEMESYGITGQDMEGIVTQLRYTQGVEVSVLAYELEKMKVKVSLRSKGNVDVGLVASYFGGGGHKVAAGCDMKGSVADVISRIKEQVAVQMEGLG
ncbi:MAG: bifunctional oligoribonuclease/PAP phosphatase NrnA [Blautia sp.]|nr:bifunctional oligoribonuclease/PAP phosphatase NrnA [Blautia sp.]